MDNKRYAAIAAEGAGEHLAHRLAIANLYATVHVLFEAIGGPPAEEKASQAIRALMDGLAQADAETPDEAVKGAIAAAAHRALHDMQREVVRMLVDSRRAGSSGEGNR
jgi:hypothetical protein